MPKKFLVAAICLFLELVISVLITKEALAFSFSISLDPQSGRTEKGGTLKTAINIYWSSSDKGRVKLFPAVEPIGVKIKFSPYSCRPPCSSIMTISISKEAENRNYSIPIVATGEGVTRTTTYYLTILPLPTSLETPRLISPLNNSTVLSLTPLLDWFEVTGVGIYHWAIGNKTGQTTNSFLVVPSGDLKYNTKYDWKVKACKDSSQDNCSNWSETLSFITPKNQGALLIVLQSQLAVIRTALLNLQEQLRKLILGGI